VSNNGQSPERARSNLCEFRTVMELAVRVPHNYMVLRGHHSGLGSRGAQPFFLSDCTLRLASDSLLFPLRLPPQQGPARLQQRIVLHRGHRTAGIESGRAISNFLRECSIWNSRWNQARCKLCEFGTVHGLAVGVRATLLLRAGRARAQPFLRLLWQRSRMCAEE
jgi:hypothetical protein